MEPSGGDRFGGVDAWEGETEGTAGAVRRRFDPDSAAVGLDHALAERQADAGPGDPGRLMDAAEHFEHALAVFGVDAEAVVDDSKIVDRLGAFPLPIEVIPMARSFVAREIVKLGGRPELRHGFTTDNGNQIIDIFGLEIREPVKLEEAINQIPGVVTNGLFARRGADIVVVSTDHGIEQME